MRNSSHVENNNFALLLLMLTCFSPDCRKSCEQQVKAMLSCVLEQLDMVKNNRIYLNDHRRRLQY